MIRVSDSFHFAKCVVFALILITCANGRVHVVLVAAIYIISYALYSFYRYYASELAFTKHSCLRSLVNVIADP